MFQCLSFVCRTVGTKHGYFCSIDLVYIISCAILNLTLQHMVKTSLVMPTVLQKCTDNLQPLNVLGLSILSGKENLDLNVKCKLQLYFC